MNEQNEQNEQAKMDRFERTFAEQCLEYCTMIANYADLLHDRMKTLECDYGWDIDPYVASLAALEVSPVWSMMARKIGIEDGWWRDLGKDEE